jgi:TolB protein
MPRPSLLAACGLITAAAPCLADTPAPIENSYPRWSPDGSRIVFQSTRDGNYEIYVMNADGSNQQRLTHQLEADRQPDWSPDGKRIVFQSFRGSNSYSGAMNSDLWSMDPDGGNLAQITATPEMAESTPRFSPDGLRIVYVSGPSGDPHLMVSYAAAGPAGYRPRELRSSQWPLPRDLANPIWSRDGRWIYFDASEGVIDTDLMAVNVNDGSRKSLLNYRYHSFYPSPSPDGKRLAFGANIERKPRQWDIIITDMDGQKPVRLVAEPGYDCCPEWSPDGKKIAFVSSRTGNQEIYAIGVDGSEMTQLTGRAP